MVLDNNSFLCRYWIILQVKKEVGKGNLEYDPDHKVKILFCDTMDMNTVYTNDPCFHLNLKRSVLVMVLMMLILLKWTIFDKPIFFF